VPVDFHHQVNCHARHTNKSPDRKLFCRAILFFGLLFLYLHELYSIKK
jgi:hypothetical protein